MWPWMVKCRLNFLVESDLKFRCFTHPLNSAEAPNATRKSLAAHLLQTARAGPGQETPGKQQVLRLDRLAQLLHCTGAGSLLQRPVFPSKGCPLWTLMCT